jgi:hypothetical protein
MVLKQQENDTRCQDGGQNSYHVSRRDERINASMVHTEAKSGHKLVI